MPDVSAEKTDSAKLRVGLQRILSLLMVCPLVMSDTLQKTGGGVKLPIQPRRESALRSSDHVSVLCLHDQAEIH